MAVSTQVRQSGNSLRSTEGMETSTPNAGPQPTETLRGVRCIRLSVRTDETTSPERQRESDDIAAAALVSTSARVLHCAKRSTWT